MESSAGMAERDAKKRRKLVKVRIGGVPEHFNYPIHMVKALGLDQKHGVDLEFLEQACGTGQMIANLKDGKVELIIALTEGIVADIAKGGSDVRILGTYVGSPLCWAISGAGEAGVGPDEVVGMKGKTFGISRYGSGSHLMAYVLAIERGWDPQKDVSFKVVGNFQKLRDSVNADETQAFMWETYTTKPFHDSGELSRLGDISTPWPCFMVAGLKSTVDLRLASIRGALSSIHEAATIFHELSSTMPAEIAQRYSLEPADAEAWYNGVRITAHRYVSEAALERALEALLEAGVLDKNVKTDPLSLIHTSVAEIRPMDIKKVRLYRGSRSLIRNLHTALERAGLHQGPVNPSKLAPFDQRHHYGGVEAVQEAMQLCGMTKGLKVINIGSGLGGPSRLMATELADAQVLAIELQHDLHSTAQTLTDRCNLGNRVTHLAGDFLEVGKFLAPGNHDAIVSWLTVLHFADRVACFSRCYNLLKPGGSMFIADLCAVGSLSVKERHDMRNEVYCHHLATSDVLVTELESVGFRVTERIDKTSAWRDIVNARCVSWDSSKNQLSRELGEEGYCELKRFYDMIRDMFLGGNVGGVVLVVTKPKGW